MAKCSNCGKSGLFLKLENGLCNDCVAIARLRLEIETLTKQKKDLQREIAIYQNRLYNLMHGNDPAVTGDHGPIPVPDPEPAPEPTPAPTPIPTRKAAASSIASVSFSSVDLKTVEDRWTVRVPILNGCPQLYGYNKVPVLDIDQDILQLMLQEDCYMLTPRQCSDGSVALLYNDNYVGKLADRVDMCADWLRRGDPIRCEMSGFRPGNEHVFLGFYRDEAARLSYRESSVVKLTAYTAEEKQYCIESLKPGEKLTCVEDDEYDEKVNVLDWGDDPIGRLPKKYADRFIDEDFAGIFFDHADEDSEGRLVPYVKIYF